jgi:hypothetical protein
LGRPQRWRVLALRRLISFGAVGHHQDVIRFCFTVRSPFVAAIFRQSQGNKKTLPTRGRQGGKILIRFLTCPPPDYPNWFRSGSCDATWTDQGQTHNPGLPGLDESLSRPSSRANSWLICLCKFSSNVDDSITSLGLCPLIF